jgi:hypothetical protein
MRRNASTRSRLRHETADRPPSKRGNVGGRFNRLSSITRCKKTVQFQGWSQQVCVSVHAIVQVAWNLRQKWAPWPDLAHKVGASLPEMQL